MTAIVGKDVEIFEILAIAHGIKLYSETGIKPNRNWTPGNMLRAATSLTGKAYKRGQYKQAIADLMALAEERNAA